MPRKTAAGASAAVLTPAALRAPRPPKDAAPLNAAGEGGATDLPAPPPPEDGADGALTPNARSRLSKPPNIWPTYGDAAGDADRKPVALELLVPTRSSDGAARKDRASLSLLPLPLASSSSPLGPLPPYRGPPWRYYIRQLYRRHRSELAKAMWPTLYG